MFILRETPLRRMVNIAQFVGNSGLMRNSAPAPIARAFSPTSSGTAATSNNIGVQCDRTIPRQRSAFQIHAGGDCD